MLQVLFLLLRRIMAVPVYLNYEFSVEQREIRKKPVPQERVLAPVSLAKRGDCGLQGQFRWSHIVIQAVPVPEHASHN